tara:strand:- start:2278 stop:2595 length:318 start_codon:yes stop_codon:yes gene_type:complete
MENQTSIRTTPKYIIWGSNSHAWTGQFIIETSADFDTSTFTTKVAKFVVALEGKPTIYFNVIGNNTFESPHHFKMFLDANDYGEVFGKAEFEDATKFRDHTLLLR